MIYRWRQYPIYKDMTEQLKKGIQASDEARSVQRSIITNTVTKYEYKEKIVKVKNKKRTIIISTISTVVGVILAGWGGYKIGKKVQSLSQ
jgi:hypothetical protein